MEFRHTFVKIVCEKEIPRNLPLAVLGLLVKEIMKK